VTRWTGVLAMTMMVRNEEDILADSSRARGAYYRLTRRSA
jgi:hypothetical protein